MFKKLFFAALVSGIFGAVISVAYTLIYKYSPLELDFTEHTTVLNLLAYNLGVTMFVCFLYFGLIKLFKKDNVVSVLIGFVLSGFVLVLILFRLGQPDPVFTVTKVMEAGTVMNPNEFVAYYGGYINPLLFIPILSWFTFKPLFIK
jgi:hypothetical protein